MNDAGWPADALEVGRIAEPWGLKGWFKVHPYSNEPQALLTTTRWHLAAANDRPGAGAPPPSLEIRAVRPHGEAIVAAARGIDDRDAAAALRGARIFLGRADFPAAGPDEFYWADLVGMTVVNRQGQALGEVTGLVDNGPQTLLSIAAEAPDGAAASPRPAPAKPAQRLIPFVTAFIDEVDLADRRIVVDWGLDY